MAETKLFRINKESTGAEKRLFKAVRLLILYGYNVKNHGWTRAYKVRMRKAEANMLNIVRACIRKNWPGYSHWECEILGSHKFIDLQANRNLKFLIILENRDGNT